MRDVETDLVKVVSRLHQAEAISNLIQPTGGAAPVRARTGCWNCGEPGHLARYCAEAKRQEGKVDKKITHGVGRAAVVYQAPPDETVDFDKMFGDDSDSDDTAHGFARGFTDVGTGKALKSREAPATGSTRWQLCVKALFLFAWTSAGIGILCALAGNMQATDHPGHDRSMNLQRVEPFEMEGHKPDTRNWRALEKKVLGTQSGTGAGDNFSQHAFESPDNEKKTSLGIHETERLPRLHTFSEQWVRDGGPIFTRKEVS